MIPKERLPGSIIFFFDKRTKEAPGLKTGCNQTGIFLTESTIIFCRDRRIREIHGTELKGTKVEIIAHSDTERIPQLIRFFENSRQNYRLFLLGLRALKFNNFEVFKVPEIMPTFHNYSSIDEYESAWKRVISKLKIGDHICIFNQKSIISKLIAFIDKGSWSHVGIYAGDGEIFEVISQGIVKRKVNVYKKEYIHLGVYRVFGIDTNKKMLEDFISSNFIRSNSGEGYPYLKALYLGIRTILGKTDEIRSPRDFR
jgi:hypothetical protein